MNPELIERFFNKQCTAGEAKEIAAYLKANPTVLEEYLSTHEWNLIAGKEMPEEFWSEIWHSIQKKNKSKIISLKLKRIAVAACLILLAGTLYYYLNTTKQNIQPVAWVHQTVLPQAEHRTVRNITNKIMTIVLEDSSVIKLFPASFVEYDVPFPANKRDIVLEGEAVFHVAKNKKKPFTVYSGALATTALGTIFSVKKSNNKNIISVKLFRGKIFIHSNDSNLNGWNKDVYLFPGEELQFNELTAMLAIKKIDSVSKPALAINNKINNKVDSISNQLNFSNALLPNVMNKLSLYYKVTIKYDTALIDTMNFTGIITKNDSLPVILKAIGQMNNLEVIENNNNEYIISKHNK